MHSQDSGSSMRLDRDLDQRRLESQPKNTPIAPTNSRPGQHGTGRQHPSDSQHFQTERGPNPETSAVASRAAQPAVAGSPTRAIPYDPSSSPLAAAASSPFPTLGPDQIGHHNVSQIPRRRSGFAVLAEPSAVHKLLSIRAITSTDKLRWPGARGARLYRRPSL